MRERGNAGATLAWLTHPVSLAATVVLLVNDHVLKATHPGLVTGKVSDVAGLVVAPALLAALCGLAAPRVPARPVALAALGLTGLGFSYVKVSPAAAHTASALWSVMLPSSVRADPTDLVALPALGLAWWVFRRVRPAPARRVSVARTLVAFPLAALAVGATSPANHHADTRVFVWQGQLVVGSNSGPSIDYTPAATRVFVATTDGRHWTDAGGGYDSDVYRAMPTELVTRACVPDEPAHCFRVVPGHLRVEETTDSGAHWRRAWGSPTRPATPWPSSRAASGTSRRASARPRSPSSSCPTGTW